MTNIFKYIFTAIYIFNAVSGFSQKNKKSTVDIYDEQDLKSEAFLIDGIKLLNAESAEKAIAYFKKAAEINPNSSGINLMLAKAYLASEDQANATIYAEKAVRADNGNKFCMKFLAEIYQKQRRFKEATDLYEKISEKFPNDIDNYFDLSNLYITQEKYADAIQIYDKIEKTIGLSEEITHQKQLIYLKQNKLEKALEEGDKLIASEPLEETYVIKQAQILISNERNEQALVMLQQAVKKNPELGEAHVLLAEIYRKQNNFAKCREELKLVFENKNLSKDIKLKILGSSLMMLKQESQPEVLDELIQLTEGFIKEVPNEAKAYMFLGDLLMKKGQIATARDRYVEATKFDKSSFELWLAIIELDSKLNQNSQLAKHTEEAVEYFPNQAIFWYHNGVANFLLKNFKEAASGLEEALNLALDNQELAKHVNALLGDTYNELKEYKKSDEAYESVLEQEPGNEIVLNNYSYYLSIRKEKLERALELSTQLIAISANNATYLDTHAWVYYTLKNYEKAREYLEKAIQVGREVSGTIVEHYGDALYQLGQKERALEEWKKAKKLGETSQWIDKKIQTGQLFE